MHAMYSNTVVHVQTTHSCTIFDECHMSLSHELWGHTHTKKTHTNIQANERENKKMREWEYSMSAIQTMIGMNALDYYMIMDQKKHSIVKCLKWNEKFFTWSFVWKKEKKLKWIFHQIQPSIHGWNSKIKHTYKSKPSSE